MPERAEGIITQRIPAGAIGPAEQVGCAFELVRATAAMLDLAAPAARLEGVLAEVETPLSKLAAAGVLAGLSLILVDGEAHCGVSVLFAADAFGEAEEVDASALRLLASPEAEPVVEILVTDEPMSRVLVERLVLPALSPDALACCQVSYQAAEGVDALVGEDSVEADLEPLGEDLEEELFGEEDESDGDISDD
jgi:hypothetical protein